LRGDVVSHSPCATLGTQSRRPASRLPPARRAFGAALADHAEAREGGPMRAKVDRVDGRGSLLRSRCSGLRCGASALRPRPVALREIPDATPALSSPDAAPRHRWRNSGRRAATADLVHLRAHCSAFARVGVIRQSGTECSPRRRKPRCLATRLSLRRTRTAKAWRQASRGERRCAVARGCRGNAARSHRWRNSGRRAATADSEPRCLATRLSLRPRPPAKAWVFARWLLGEPP